MNENTLMLRDLILSEDSVSATINIFNNHELPIDRISFLCLLLDGKNIGMAESSWASNVRIEPNTSFECNTPSIWFRDYMSEPLKEFKLKVFAKLYINNSYAIGTVLLNSETVQTQISTAQKLKLNILSDGLIFSYFPPTLEADRAFYSLRGAFKNSNLESGQYIGISLEVYNRRGIMLTEACEYIYIPASETKLLSTTLKFSPEPINLKMNANISIIELEEIDYLSAEISYI